jgi:LuxR family maltose regulon positive regulatory protein
MSVARGGRAFPLLETKLRPAAGRAGIIDRARVVEPLLRRSGPPVVTLFAPPGYGKTTVLGQWASAESRPVAWLSVGELDNDPAVFVPYLASALATIGPVESSLIEGAPIARGRTLASAIPRLLYDIHRWRSPAVLIIDDVHRLTDRATLDGLAAFIDHLPEGFRVGLAGRTPPELPIPRLRAEQRLLEVDRSILALDERETAALALAVGIALSDAEIESLLDRTEGWAAGIYLATLAYERSGGETWPRNVSGVDKPIAAYLRSELTHRLTDDEMHLLTRSAIFDIVHATAVEPVTGVEGGAGMLEQLADRNLLIESIGQRGDAFRYHNLLREFLLAELERREPGQLTTLHRAAAMWYADQGDQDASIRHLLAAGEVDVAAERIGEHGIETFEDGRIGTLQRWLGAFSVEAVQRHPRLAVLGAWVATTLGDSDEATRYAAIADGDAARNTGTATGVGATLTGEIALLRALRCRHGPRDMHANASWAVNHLAAGTGWRNQALWLRGWAEFLMGDTDATDASLAESIRDAQFDSSPDVAPLAKRAALAIRRSDWAAAEALTTEATVRMTEAGYEYVLSALLVYAVQARVRAHRGDADGARASLVRAQLVRPLASTAVPWFCVDALTELARAYLAVSDPSGAQVVIREAEHIVRQVPALGTLTDELIAVRRNLADSATTLAGSSALTTAELRVLPYLPTYLTFPEIADRLSISRNTVKTHAMSIYGKLWASSRGEAVERAVELGLLEPYPGLDLRLHPAGADADGAG